ncbi:MAG: glucose-6-phosphate isomerase [Psychrobium sp.]
MEFIDKLHCLANEQQSLNITEQFLNNSQRYEQLNFSAAHLAIDYSKQNLLQATKESLLGWANESGLDCAIKAMFSGKEINHTEKRKVLHSVLRAPHSSQVSILGDEIAQEIQDTNDRMSDLVSQLTNGELRGFKDKAITDVVAIGIGGSYYGPKICAQALKPYATTGIKVHYVANVDGGAIEEKIAALIAATTLVVIISKTFTTQETILNANFFKSWLLAGGCPKESLAKHLVAVTSAPDQAVEFGVAQERVLPMWDWVGGRFSLWSAVGFPLACAIGIDNLLALKQGAYDMDQHFQTAPFEENMPVMLGLLGVWNRSFLGYTGLAVLPYDHALRDFPGYLQQLDMESNGKRVKRNGQAVELATAPMVFGQEGTNSQHAFMQMMHQGLEPIPSEFILPLTSHHGHEEHHKTMVANCLAQSEALMRGIDLEEVTTQLKAHGVSDEEIEHLAPHKVMPGNSPSITITMDRLTPQAMGSLMALYEHKIFVQGVMWDINPFDQWGVELGKQIGKDVLASMDSETESNDFSASTQNLLAKYKALNS